MALALAALNPGRKSPMDKIHLESILTPDSIRGTKCHQEIEIRVDGKDDEMKKQQVVFVR